MVLAALVFLTMIDTLHAVSSQTWRQRERAEFEQGDLKGAALSADGAIRLARPLDPLYEADQSYIWALAEAPGGAIYAAGGNDGVIYRVDPSGVGEIFFSVEESQVHSLAVGADGHVFAGTAPGGKVYRIDPDGGQVWLYETGEEYVWALVFDDQGDLFAGTGSEGRILKIDQAGHGTIFFDSAETHIRCLLATGGGELLAGTDGHGLVFRISPGGEGFVLYDAPFDEVVSLTAASDGTIYAAVLGQKSRSGRGKRRRAPARRPATPPAPAVPENGPPGTPPPAQSAQQGARQKKQTQQRVAIAMQGKVLAISTDGFAREVWSGEQEAILSLAIDAGGSILMGSNVDGRIYALDADGGVSEIGHNPSSEVTALQRRTRGPDDRRRRGRGGDRRRGEAGGYEFLVAGSNPGTLGLLRTGYALEGTFESEVLDARSFATWGRLTWRAETPRGTTLVIQARSGNTEDPDRTWSAWGDELTDPRGARLGLPPARFLQWRAVLKTDDRARTPSLGEVAVTYLQRNLPPEIGTVEVHAPGVAFQRVASGTKGQQKDNRPGNSAVAAGARRRPRPQSRRSYQQGARSITWQPTDANNDELAFDVYYRAVDEKTWKPLRSRIDERFVTLDSTSMPDGTYVVRIVATDAPSNPPGQALTAERVSEQFDVDNTPPRVERIRAQVRSPSVRLTFEVNDTFSLVREAAYSVNAGDWVEASPRDGVNDDLEEFYDLLVPTLPPGEHSIVVRAVDAAGNVGAGKTVIEIP